MYQMLLVRYEIFKFLWNNYLVIFEKKFDKK